MWALGIAPITLPCSFPFQPPLYSSVVSSPFDLPVQEPVLDRFPALRSCHIGYDNTLSGSFPCLDLGFTILFTILSRDPLQLPHARIFLVSDCFFGRVSNRDLDASVGKFFSVLDTGLLPFSVRRSFWFFSFNSRSTASTLLRVFLTAFPFFHLLRANVSQRF